MSSAHADVLLAPGGTEQDRQAWSLLSASLRREALPALTCAVEEMQATEVRTEQGRTSHFTRDEGLLRVLSHSSRV